MPLKSLDDLTTPDRKGRVRLTSLNQLIQARQRIRGTWKLGPNHELQYRRLGADESVVLKGELFAAEPTGLVFQITEQFQEGGFVDRLLTLQGRWQADAQNRLNFLVEREKGRNDRLTFQGAWEVGEGQQVLYRVQKDLREDKEARLLRFQGYWGLSGSNQLAYVLDSSSDSSFRFRGAFQTFSVQAKKGQIRYQIGIELQGKSRLKTITLFGKWKLSRDLALDFELEYGDGLARAITFGAVYGIRPGGTVEARLIGRDGRPLGLEILFSQEFLKGQGEAFVRLRRSLEETAAEGGVRFRW